MGSQPSTASPKTTDQEDRGQTQPNLSKLGRQLLAGFRPQTTSLVQEEGFVLCSNSATPMNSAKYRYVLRRINQ